MSRIDDVEILLFLQMLIRDGGDFQHFQKKLHQRYNSFFSKRDLLQIYLRCLFQKRFQEDQEMEKRLRLKSSRSNSGELEVSTMLPPDHFSCRYDCSMCPDERKLNGASVDMARSYLSSEGTPKLGMMEEFSPIFQVWRRCIQYEYLMGHKIDKILHILLGGTFHSYDKKVRYEFIHLLYYACNTYYAYLSLRNHGIFSSSIMIWVEETDPFLHKLSLKNTIGQDILSKIRPIGSLEEEKEINAGLSAGRITGIVIETRPDQICIASLKEMRRLGVTRVQIGVQHTDETVLRIMNRRHTVSASIKAIKFLKDAGFKVDIHVLMDCPGTTLEKDFECVKMIFNGPDFQPDMVKLYICVDVPFTKNRLYRKNFAEYPPDRRDTIQEMMQKGNFLGIKRIADSLHINDSRDCFVWEPMAERDYHSFKDMLVRIIGLIPAYVRLNRFHRDFPRADSAPLRLGYESGTLRTNLQQICMESLEQEGLRSKDIRARELRDAPVDFSRCQIFVHQYRSSEGIDFFISVEQTLENGRSEGVDQRTQIIGMVRCRATDWDLGIDPLHRYYPPCWFLRVFHKRSLRIRELHVYGNLQSKRSESHGQHAGVGKFLLKLAEQVAILLRLEQVVVIAGVGVQKYYESQGYHLSDEYEIKDVSAQTICPILYVKDTSRWISIEKIKRSVLPITGSYSKEIIPLNHYHSIVDWFYCCFFYIYGKWKLLWRAFRNEY